MVRIVRQRDVGSLPQARHFVAADVGGTHARLGVVQAGGDAARNGTLQVAHYRKYACAAYPSLAAVLQEYFGTVDVGPIREVVIGLPGYALDGVVINVNLPWPVSIAQMREALRIDAIALVNDFEAVAHAVPRIDPAETVVVAPGTGEALRKPVIVVGPGTGLGAALRIPNGPRDLVLATEAGQAAFAPTTDLEIEILRVLRRKTSHVSVEHLLSGPGLMNLYAALCALRGELPTLHAPVEISDAALRAGDSAAAQALHAFCGLMGSVVGDLVLTTGAQGGVYLAGGILPQIRDFLLKSGFRERFLDKGAMRAVLERVPVRLIEHGQLGVIGAASWHLDQRQDQERREH